jgi:GBP family porin
MKKSLLASAVLGAFAGAASAQSSVTLYGIVDVAYQYDDFERGGASSRNAIDAGKQAGNRLVVRGSEAIGGGTNAIFALEAGYSMDTGAGGQGGRLFGRQAWVGLEGGWGTLVAGKIASFSSGTGAFDMFGQIDPLGTAWDYAGLQSTFSPGTSFRLDNAIMYRSPKIAGFQAGAGYSFQTGPNNAAPILQEAAGDGNNNRTIFTGVSWGAGPFYAALTYDQIKFGSAAAPAGAPGAADQKMLQIGGTFDLKFIKLHAAYAKEDAVRPTVIQAFLAAGPGADADAWMVGLSAPLGAFTLFGSYQERDGDSVLVGGVPVEGDGEVFAIGGKYDLSRRTNLYLVYANTEGDKSLSPGIAATDFVNRQTIMLGVNHRF